MRTRGKMTLPILPARASESTSWMRPSSILRRTSDVVRDRSARPSVSIHLRLVTTYGTVNPWSALGDRTRFAIFKRLAAGPMAVSELADGLPVSRPAVSQHLKVLKCAGLVRDRPQGTRRVYQVDPQGVEALRAELDVFWDKALAAYQAIADEGERTS